MSTANHVTKDMLREGHTYLSEASLMVACQKKCEGLMLRSVVAFGYSLIIVLLRRQVEDSEIVPPLTLPQL